MFKKANIANLLRSSVVCLAMASYHSVGGCPARAQSPQTVKAFAAEAHTGPIEKALVGVEVNIAWQNGNSMTLHGNGIVIRCDGFVLTPQALFGATVGANQKVMVTLDPGAENPQKVAARIVGSTSVVRRAFAGKPESFVILKLAETHTPALRLLLPDALTDEKQALLVWSAWDTTAGRFLPIQKRLVALLDPANRAPGANNRLKFAQDEALPIPGAILIGPEGMGIGIATNPNTSMLDFATFATLNSLTNCVTPQSATDAQFTQLVNRAGGEEPAAAPETPQPENGDDTKAGAGGAQTAPPAAVTSVGTAGAAGMVRVGGGSTRLNPMLQFYQTDMASLHTACVAPFLIDRFEVTNAQYWKFWQSLALQERQRHKAEYYPAAWTEAEPPFPSEVGNVPVLGVRLVGAQAYAKWVGKRLPTPYEWSLAAFGPGGGTVMPGWVQRYVKDRQQTWQRIVEAHVQYAQQNPIVGQMGFEHWGGISFAAQPQLPWLMWYPWEAIHARWSSETVLRLTEHLWRDWKDPQHVLAVGSRPFDVSPCGARDMIFNADELVMPAQGWSAFDGANNSEMYMQVAFPDMPPAERQGVWAFYQGRVGYMPPSSRFLGFRTPLYSRRLRGPATLGVTDAGIYYDYMLLNANLREVSDMMAYTSGGMVSLEFGPTTFYPDFYERNIPVREEPAIDIIRRYGEAVAEKLKPYVGGEPIRTNFRDTVWFPFWKNANVPFHREMGRDVKLAPLAAPPDAQQPDPNMSTYLVPGGFRCVR